MKKLIFVLLGVGLSVGAFAQTEHPVKKEEMSHLRGDVRAHKAATHQVNNDLAHVRVKKAVRDHRDVSRVNKDERADAKRLRERGVSHPVTKAKRQVKVQDDNRHDHTN
ncbi:MAG TPA: hypothetical protein VGM89_15080 [Puia sp.]